MLSRLHTNQGCGCVQIEQWQIFSGLRASARRNFQKREWVLTDMTGISPQRHKSGTCGGCKGAGWAMNVSIFSKYSRPNKPQGCCLYVFINCNCIVREQTKVFDGKHVRALPQWWQLVQKQHKFETNGRFLMNIVGWMSFKYGPGCRSWGPTRNLCFCNTVDCWRKSAE